jgi:hypothetical protein
MKIVRHFLEIIALEFCGFRPPKKLAAGCLRHMLYCSVKNESSTQPGAEREELRQGLAELREALLRLHKALMEFERIGYEKTFGKIASPYQFLQLLTNDPWFAWLRPVSQLVAAMDEMLEAKEPLTVAGVKSLADQAKALLVAKTGGHEFSGHYDEALQRDPDVVFAHAEVVKAMRAAKW